LIPLGAKGQIFCILSDKALILIMNHLINRYGYGPRCIY
jgi:hypothetical protein